MQVSQQATRSPHSSSAHKSEQAPRAEPGERISENPVGSAMPTHALLHALYLSLLVQATMARWPCAASSAGLDNQLAAVPALVGEASFAGQQLLQARETWTNVSRLIFGRFFYLFPDVPEPVREHFEQLAAGAQNESAQAAVHSLLAEALAAPEAAPALETVGRRLLGELQPPKQKQAAAVAAADQQAAAAAAAAELERKFLKIMDRVFSRVELPEVYRASGGRSAGAGAASGRCSLHLGCLDEISNFPILLKKTNVSSSFTVYTRATAKGGRRIVYEPVMHHQLEELDSASAGGLPLKLAAAKLQRAAAASGESSSGAGAAKPAARRAPPSASWLAATKIKRSQEYPFDLSALEQCGFNASLGTRIIIGGYFAKEGEGWIDELVRQWLYLEPANIIKVSWADANRGLYHTAAYNSRIVGRQLTLFIHYLDQLFKVNLNRFHLVGHSLGAHIAGIVGADNEGRIARITGLDPAGPIFVELNSSMRLDPSDARFVDVLHTNGGSITKGALGLSTPSGHVDYYSNGGSTQPGCYFSSVTKSIMDPVERVACNHRRSYRYFTEIIRMHVADKLAARTLAAAAAADGSAPGAARHQPRAFLFESANVDELTRMTQPEIMLAAYTSVAQAKRGSPLGHGSVPLKRRLEFHLFEPEFPAGKRAMYFFKTRSEAPFFASRQYAIILRTNSSVKRKMVLVAKIEQTLVAEVELEEIAGIFTLAFAPNDLSLMQNFSLSLEHFQQGARAPQLSLLWRPRSFNLLLGGQQNELHLSSVELGLIDTDSEPEPIIRYAPAGALPQSAAGAGERSNAAAGPQSNQTVALNRNQWHKFDGCPQAAVDFRHKSPFLR